METTETATPAIQETVQALYNHVAHEMAVAKRDSTDVINSLVDQGVEYEAAYTIVSNVQQQIDDAKKARARKDMLYGGLWFFGGILVTVFTYSAASGGGSYVVAWGAILFGGIQFFKGVANL